MANVKELNPLFRIGEEIMSKFNKDMVLIVTRDAVTKEVHIAPIGRCRKGMVIAMAAGSSVKNLIEAATPK